jgi:hypothetical protein
MLRGDNRKESRVQRLYLPALIVGVLVSLGFTAGKQATGWEYHLLKTTAKRWEQQLDSLGAAGWELVAYGPQRVVTDAVQYRIDSELYGVFVFKRLLPQ